MNKSNAFKDTEVSNDFIFYNESEYDSWPPQSFRMLRNRSIRVLDEITVNLNPYTGHSAQVTLSNAAQSVLHNIDFKTQDEYDFINEKD